MKKNPIPRDLVENIEGLPTLPTVVARISQLVQDPNTSAADLNEVLSNDLALSSRLLKLANSSYYGFPNKISSVTHAVVILGFNTVRNVVLSAFVLDAFEARDVPFGYRDFWVHSVGTAAAASALLKPQGRRMADDGFICGLLHDIGKVVLHQFARERFAEIVKQVRRGNRLIVEVEQEVLGFTHTEVGGALLEVWGLPRFLRLAVEDHHILKSEEEEVLQLASSVHVADIFARALMIGNGGDGRIPRLREKAAGTLGINPGNVGDMLHSVSDEMKRAEGFLELL